MKSYLFILCFLFSLSLSAQKIRFTDQNGWYVDDQYTISDVKSGWAYKSDTIIGGTLYRTLGVTHDIYPPGTLYSTRYWVREDTVNKTIYILHDFNEEEDTLMCYNLAVGDVLHQAHSSQTRTVMGIDSIWIEGYFYKTFSMRLTGGINYTFIEGLGTSQGPLYPYHYTYSGAATLICFRTSGHTSTFGHAPWVTGPGGVFYNHCPLAVPLSPAQTPITITPNPVTDQLTIKATEKGARINILNCLGQTVLHTTAASSEVQLNVSHLPHGIYLLNINGEKAGTFVKQ